MINYKTQYDKVMGSFSCINEDSFCKYVDVDFYISWFSKLLYTDSYIDIKGEIYCYNEFDGIYIVKTKKNPEDFTDYCVDAIMENEYNEKLYSILSEKEYNELIFLLKVEFKKYIILLDWDLGDIKYNRIK